MKRYIFIDSVECSAHCLKALLEMNINIVDIMYPYKESAKLFNSKLGEHPFPRSIENLKALATFRDATVGVKYAEAFMILKDIW